MKYLLNILLLINTLFADIELYSNKSDYLVGEHIEVFFSGLNSSGSDWIGIYKSGTSNEEYLNWQYTDGTQVNNYNYIESGDINFSPITLPTGNYDIRLFYNNNYDLISSYPITIVDNCSQILDSIFDDTFNVMTFNTWHSAQYGYGGLERVAEIIADLNIDVIGFQETDPSSILEIQSLLINFHEGYEQLYVTPSESNISIISRFPIIEVYDYDLYGIGADILITDIDTIKFISSHLSAYPYGPYDLYEGVSVEEVLDNEISTRYTENLDIYNQIIINSNNNPSLPVIYVGDHNTPSLLDWDINNIKQNFGFEINWPVSEFLLNNGFSDSYREIYVSVYDYPGLSWSPGYPKDSFDTWDIHDRIDMIYYRPGIEKILYPIESYIYDCDPWPSDHRAVITEFSICLNLNIGDLNLDDIINILDIILLVDEILFPSSSYCLLKQSDIDFNEDINILDIIQLVNIILEES